MQAPPRRPGWREMTVVLGALAAGAVLVTYPLAFGAGHQLPDLKDPVLVSWTLAWDAAHSRDCCAASGMRRSCIRTIRRLRSANILSGSRSSARRCSGCWTIRRGVQHPRARVVRVRRRRDVSLRAQPDRQHRRIITGRRRQFGPVTAFVLRPPEIEAPGPALNRVDARSFVATASDPLDLTLLFDGDPRSRWLTGHPQDGREWIEVTLDRKSTRLNSSHSAKSRMPSSA